ncbi:MAG: hypothetical protein ACOVO1_02960, partial [Chitinophagaceae bacterium]
MKKGLLALLLLMCSFFNANAVTYYSIASAHPGTTSNWKTARDGTGSSPGNFTTSGDIFIIQGTGGGSGAPHTMNSTSSVTF